MKVAALILAAGKGVRMGADMDKQLLPLRGEPLLLHTLRAFEQNPLVDEIILVAEPQTYTSVCQLPEFAKLRKIVPGGEVRQDSCWLGLQHVEDAEITAVHDGARPLINQATISACIQAAIQHGASIAAVPVKDTLKESQSAGFVQRTVDRSCFWQVQTPQTFRTELLRQAIQHARQIGFVATDDASLVEQLGHPVKIVPSSYENIKITTPEDLLVAEQILNSRQKEQLPMQTDLPLRLGLGHDSHRFVADDDSKPLVLGGVLLQGQRGLAGNSDADVILHAIFNGITQALGEHSLGFYADPLCLEHGITDSSAYLTIPLQMLAERGYQINNIGISVECRRPRLEDQSPRIRARVAEIMGISIQQVGLTATSGEGLTSFGRGEGIQAWALVSLTQITPRRSV